MSTAQVEVTKPENIEMAAEAVRTAKMRREQAEVDLRSIRARRDEMAAKVHEATSRVDEIERARPDLVQAVASGEKPESELQDQRGKLKEARMASADCCELLEVIEKTVIQAERDLEKSVGGLRNARQRFYRKLAEEMRENLLPGMQDFFHKYLVAVDLASGGLTVGGSIASLLKAPSAEVLKGVRLKIEGEYF